MNKRNFQKELEAIIEENEAKAKRPTLLLHSCCAPCSSHCLELLSEFFDVTVFYYNPNIYPFEEFSKRAAEQKRLISEMPFKNKVNYIELQGDEMDFYRAVKGFENLGEGSERCFRCFEMRLRRCAEKASELHFDYFCTTLSISPLKDAGKLNEIGEAVAAELGSVKFLPSDFKKKEGYKNSIELSKRYGLYRQDYCGCVFSKKEREENRKIKENQKEIL